MLKIRLARIGRKNDPTFRVVVTEHTRGPKSGKHVEILGNYNPKMDKITLNGERIKYWISNGAQVSDTVHNLLVGDGIISGKKINVLPKKTPIVKETDTEESAEVATASDGGDKTETTEMVKSTDEAVEKDTKTEESKEDVKEEEVKEVVEKEEKKEK